MPKFLSQEWTDALLAALDSSDEIKESLRGVHLTLQQIVTGGPGGEVSYWTTFDGAAVSGDLGTTKDPDVTITQDYETAMALSRGELNAQAAFMQGKLKITGNMGKLLQHQAAIQALGPAMASVVTQY